MGTVSRWRTCLSALVATLLLTAVAAPAAGQGTRPPEAVLLGHWESVGRTEGGLGPMMEFAPGGLIVFMPGAVVDEPYRMVGDTAVVEMPPEGQLRYFFRGDTLIALGPQGGPTVAYRRRSAPVAGAPRLVGTWSAVAVDTTASEPARRAFARATTAFTADGQSHLRVPFRSDTASYRIAGDTLVITSAAAAGETRVRYAIADAVLTLTPVGSGEPAQFRRAP